MRGNKIMSFNGCNMSNKYTTEKLILLTVFTLVSFISRNARAEQFLCKNVFYQNKSQLMELTNKDLDQIYESILTSRGRRQSDYNLPRKDVIRDIYVIDSNLRELQLQEMSDYFNSTFNFKTTPDNILKTRDQISKSNLQRILKKVAVRPDSVRFNNLKQNLYSSLAKEFSSFNHQTTSPESSNEALWFSSLQLEKMGFGAGLQADLSFNRNFLKTQNWIFFSLGPIYDYGPNSKNVKFQFVEDIGIISPFLMHSFELLQFGITTRPDLLTKIQIDIQKKYPDIWSDAIAKVYQEGLTPDTNLGIQRLFTHAFILVCMRTELNEAKFLKKYSSIFSELKHEQINYIFTAEDYLTLSTEVLAAYIWKNSLYNVNSYTAGTDLKALLKTAFNSFWLPWNYEVKIPVAMRTSDFVKK
jgi:hypothetical protein